MTIRVLIADDHPVVAEALRYLIQAQAHMQAIACVQNGHDAVRLARTTSPDVVLMDNAMPVLNGTEATQLICAHRPETRVVMLSVHADPFHVCRALQAGATGYVIKKSVAREVVEAIRAVHGGKRYLSKPLVPSVIDQFVQKTALDPLHLLSSRERQVLQLLAEGCTVAIMASTLSLSPKTVETYRARLMGKLNVRDLAGLIRFALQRGVASLE